MRIRAPLPLTNAFVTKQKRRRKKWVGKGGSGGANAKSRTSTLHFGRQQARTVGEGTGSPMNAVQPPAPVPSHCNDYQCVCVCGGLEAVRVQTDQVQIP